MQTRTRVRRLGFYVQRRQWPRTLRRESGGDFRADSRTGLCVIRRSDQAIDERHAGRSAHLFRRCRRAGRCGPASSRDDSSRGQRRTLHRGIGQCHIDGRHRQDSAGPPRDLGQTSAPSSVARLGREARRKTGCVSATGSASAWRDQKCHERQGETYPWLVTAL